MAIPSTIETLERVLNPNSTVQWRRDAASVWSLCDRDPLLLAEWCLRRLEMGLCEQPSEEKYLRHVMGSCHAVVDAEMRPMVQAVRRSDFLIHQDYLKAEKQRVADWDERRQLMAEREEKRRQASSREAIRQRVAAAPKPAVLTLHRQRLDRTLKATPAPEPMTIAPASETKTPSRRASTKCGQRLGEKIDQVLAEIREHQAHEDACASSCCAELEVKTQACPDVIIATWLLVSEESTNTAST